MRKQAISASLNQARLGVFHATKETSLGDFFMTIRYSLLLFVLLSLTNQPVCAQSLTVQNDKNQLRMVQARKEITERTKNGVTTDQLTRAVEVWKAGYNAPGGLTGVGPIKQPPIHTKHSGNRNSSYKSQSQVTPAFTADQLRVYIRQLEQGANLLEGMQTKPSLSKRNNPLGHPASSWE